MNDYAALAQVMLI